MIQSFSDDDTAHLFREEKSRRFGNIARVALRKLIQMNQAKVLQDLAVPPGNRLEALQGDLTGYHSIRINDRWRITFRWTENGPAEVKIVDYH
ncbi:MAG: plasmid maintenance system killer [Verrucomicrobia bacterium]|jgi:proteic killer suppression protein|nr:plasmid maintenance system killer [Verrucomicrobiota bacterium]